MSQTIDKVTKERILAVLFQAIQITAETTPTLGGGKYRIRRVMQEGMTVQMLVMDENLHPHVLTVKLTETI